MDLGKKLLGHFYRLALGLNVLFMNNVLLNVHEYGLGSSRTNVYPQIDLKPGRWRSFSQGDHDAVIES